MRLRAPAKLNLCLYLGPRRDDGLHELCSLFCPITLSDRIVVADAEADQVVCPGVEGPNLAAEALAGLRARGWDRAGVRVEIDKRIPVAAGLGGGSADAAAVLRMAGEQVDVADLARGLGADVPSQLDPRFALVCGAGEAVEALPPPPHFGVVLVPGGVGLSTARVYEKAEMMGLGRDSGELESIASKLREVAGGGGSPLHYAQLLVNDLAPAARSIQPEVDEALEALAGVGAAVASITGSGPTAFGLFADIAAADRAAAELSPRFAGAIVAGPEVER